MNTSTSKRFVGEVVELSRDCELGQEGDRAVVTALAGHFMTLAFPDRGPGPDRYAHIGADYKFLRAYEGVVEWTDADLGLNRAGKPAGNSLERGAALRELRDLVATYLEGSADAPRATELLDALEPLPSMLSDTFWEQLKSTAKGLADEPSAERETRECAMFGCTAQALDRAIGNREPRDIAMYAMGTLSNAQELIRRSEYEGQVEWAVTSSFAANTIRQLMNVAKYAIDKAVPR